MPKVETAPAKKAAAKKAPAKKAAAAPNPASDDFGDNWFVSLDDVIDHTNTLLYGREGSAKTTNATRLANAFSHLPKGKGMILVINAEGGLRKQALRNRGIDTDKIVLWPDPKNHERVTPASMNRIHLKIKSDLERDPESWGGVIFDSATEIYQALLDFAQQKRIAGLVRQGRDVDEDFVDIADYGNMSKMFRDSLRKFRDLPCHFVVTALERRTVDKDTGKPTYGPDVTPALQSDLLGYVDFVLMCKPEDEDGPFRALTRANSRYRAKDRFDVLPQVIAEPFLDRVLQYVSGDLTPETDPLQAQIKSKTVKANEKADDPDDEEDEDTKSDDDD